MDRRTYVSDDYEDAMKVANEWRTEGWVLRHIFNNRAGNEAFYTLIFSYSQTTAERYGKGRKARKDTNEEVTEP